MKEEKDPNGKSAKEPGAKLDAGKSPVWQGCIDYFPKALEAKAFVSLFGAEKYDWKGWETVPNGFARYSNALVRHLTDNKTLAARDQRLADLLSQLAPKATPEQLVALAHAAQVSWNADARLELLIKEINA